jgi:hypothetical protein
MSIVLDGSNLTTTGVINSATAVASTSGTSIDFTGLPSGLKRITVMYAGLSTTGTSDILVRLGTSGGIVSTGYLGTAILSSSGGTAVTNFTTGFGIFQNAQGTAWVGHGLMTICFLGSNIWTATSIVGESDTARGSYFGGSVTLSAAVTTLRITTSGGTDTFDAGSVNILYE